MLLLLIAGALAGPPISPASCVGLDRQRPGLTLAYAGTRYWSRAGEARVDSGVVRWTSTVVQSRAGSGFQLSLVRGFVSELAWSEPGTRPGYSILACLGGAVRHFRFASRAEAVRALTQWPGSARGQGTLLLAEPLQEGAVVGQPPGRSDDLYGWVVERLEAPPSLPASCRATSPVSYRLTLRTLADHQIMEWREGVGVTAYTYAHHGTPAGAEVRLVGCGSAGLTRAPGRP